MKEKLKQPDKETKDLAYAISHWVNTHNRYDFAGLINHIATDHRTLQQKFTAVCLAWFVHLAGLTENSFDRRNEASVRVAREIVEKVPNVTLGLPLI
jgi:hypothetical protein